jgi:peptide/nickel transport system permease protein
MDMSVAATIKARAPTTMRCVSFFRSLGDFQMSAAVGTLLVAIVVAATLLAPILTDADPLALGKDVLLGPTGTHPMGTDDLGRDVLARVLYGGRVSLSVGIFSAIIGMLFGMSVGMIAGFFGGVVDDVLMRLTEVFQVLPRLIVAIVVVAVIGTGFFKIVVVIGCLSWPATARIIRSRVMVLRNEDFVAAATMSGAGWPRLILRQIVPNVLPFFMVSATLQIASAILSESFLSFLGLGDPDRPSWGYLLQQGQIFTQQAWWLTTFPGIALAITILGLNLLGDGFGASMKIVGWRR